MDGSGLPSNSRVLERAGENSVPSRLEAKIAAGWPLTQHDRSNAAERYSEKLAWRSSALRSIANSSRMPVTQRSSHYGTKQRMDLLHREQTRSSFVKIRHNLIIAALSDEKILSAVTN